MIELDDLKIGTVYKLAARNLSLGVYAGDGRFIGIREKFGNRFLDTEFEYTTSTSFGTARAKAIIGVVVGIPLVMSLGSECGACGQPTNFDMSRPAESRWQHADGTVMCDRVFSVRTSNTALFEGLEAFEVK